MTEPTAASAILDAAVAAIRQNADPMEKKVLKEVLSANPKMLTSLFQGKAELLIGNDNRDARRITSQNGIFTSQPIFPIQTGVPSPLKSLLTPPPSRTDTTFGNIVWLNYCCTNGIMIIVKNKKMQYLHSHLNCPKCDKKGKPRQKAVTRKIAQECVNFGTRNLHNKPFFKLSILIVHLAFAFDCYGG